MPTDLPNSQRPAGMPFANKVWLIIVIAGVAAVGWIYLGPSPKAPTPAPKADMSTGTEAPASSATTTVPAKP
ncbi:hypothetical protein [Oryzibacter oryziterrae]|uniref:hypothetical protein n=1 Tax=Oryzibacter oryziterrae TaxID=2766474 RepID=UPI001F3E64CF|nr:hypothetical protein [Oryzibacter oryziterrae]